MSIINDHYSNLQPLTLQMCLKTNTSEGNQWVGGLTEPDNNNEDMDSEFHRRASGAVSFYAVDFITPQF